MFGFTENLKLVWNSSNDRFRIINISIISIHYLTACDNKRHWYNQRYKYSKRKAIYLLIYLLLISLFWICWITWQLISLGPRIVGGMPLWLCLPNMRTQKQFPIHRGLIELEKKFSKLIQIKEGENLLCSLVPDQLNEFIYMIKELVIVNSIFAKIDFEELKMYNHYSINP